MPMISPRQQPRAPPDADERRGRRREPGALHGLRIAGLPDLLHRLHGLEQVQDGDEVPADAPARGVAHPDAAQALEVARGAVDPDAEEDGPAEEREEHREPGDADEQQRPEVLPGLAQLVAEGQLQRVQGEVR